MKEPDRLSNGSPPDAADPFATQGWQALIWAMTTLGIVFLMAGAVSVPLGLLVMALSGGEDLISSLLLLGWMLVPIISGALLMCASMRLASSTRNSSTWLVVVAASTFAGLAWMALAAAIILNPTSLG